MNYIEPLIHVIKTFSAILSALLGVIKAVELLGKWRSSARPKSSYASSDLAPNHRMIPAGKNVPRGAMLALCVLCYGMGFAMIPPFAMDVAMFVYASGGFGTYLLSAGVLTLALSAPGWMFFQAEQLRIKLRGYAL